METTCTIGWGQTPAEAARCAGSYLAWIVERWAGAFEAVFTRAGQATIGDWLIVALTVFSVTIYIADRLMGAKAQLDEEHRARMKSRDIQGVMPLTKPQALGLVVTWLLLLAALVFVIVEDRSPQHEAWFVEIPFLAVIASGYVFVARAVRAAFSANTRA